MRKFGGGDYIQSLYGDPHKWNNVLDAFASIRQLAHARGVGVMVMIFPMVVGVVMAFRKTATPKLVLAHKVAMSVVAVGMIGGVLFMVLKM